MPKVLPKPLQPTEVRQPKLFDFDSQASDGRVLRITRTCSSCGVQNSLAVWRVRKDSREGTYSGLCHGCKIREQAKALNGPQHPRYKGRCLDTRGYVRVRRPQHPAASSKGYVLEHRLVMERELGRYLTSEESVHHRNGRRADNRPENLELWVGVGAQPRGIRAVDEPHCPTCTCTEHLNV